MVAAAPAALAAMVLVGGRSSSGGTGLRQRPDRNRTDTVGRQQEFAREQVHLGLAALTTAVIDDTVEGDRPGFGGTGRIDVRDRASIRVVAEFDMPDFMRDEKGLVEGRTDPRRPRRCVVGAGVTGPGSTPSTCLRRNRSCDRS